jgi:hypothetical protein
MATDFRSSMKILEKGDVFFLFRPNADQFAPAGSLDIRQFYLVLHPQRSDHAVPADRWPHAIEQELPPCLSIFASTTTS